MEFFGDLTPTTWPRRRMRRERPFRRRRITVLRGGRAADDVLHRARGQGRGRASTPGRGRIVIDTVGAGRGRRLCRGSSRRTAGGSTRGRSSRSAPSAFDGACLREQVRRRTRGSGTQLMQRFAGSCNERLQAARLRLLDLYGHARPMTAAAADDAPPVSQSTRRRRETERIPSHWPLEPVDAPARRSPPGSSPCCTRFGDRRGTDLDQRRPARRRLRAAHDPRRRRGHPRPVHAGPGHGDRRARAVRHRAGRLDDGRRAATWSSWRAGSGCAPLRPAILHVLAHRGGSAACRPGRRAHPGRPAVRRTSARPGGRGRRRRERHRRPRPSRLARPGRAW